jgi:hypothetical protein
MTSTLDIRHRLRHCSLLTAHCSLLTAHCSLLLLLLLVVLRDQRLCEIRYSGKYGFKFLSSIESLATLKARSKEGHHESHDKYHDYGLYAYLMFFDIKVFLLSALSLSVALICIMAYLLLPSVSQAHINIRKSI